MGIAEFMDDFAIYVPRDRNPPQRDPHVRVDVQTNGRVRFHLYVAVRQWLTLHKDAKTTPSIEVLVDEQNGRIALRRAPVNRESKDSSIPVQGLQNRGYISLPGFGLDFDIAPGKYPAELRTVEGVNIAVINLSNTPR